MSDIVHFELNNWFAGRDYPPDGNLKTWVESGKFNNDAWCKENRLCVTSGVIDMSENWCIAAEKEWVDRWCPELIKGGPYTYEVGIYEGRNRIETRYGDYSDFLTYPDAEGELYGFCGQTFLDYCEENFGVTFVGEVE